MLIKCLPYPSTEISFYLLNKLANMFTFDWVNVKPLNNSGFT